MTKATATECGPGPGAKVTKAGETERAEAELAEPPCHSSGAAMEGGAEAEPRWWIAEHEAIAGRARGAGAVKAEASPSPGRCRGSETEGGAGVVATCAGRTEAEAEAKPECRAGPGSPSPAPWPDKPALPFARAEPSCSRRHRPSCRVRPPEAAGPVSAPAAEAEAGLDLGPRDFEVERRAEGCRDRSAARETFLSRPAAPGLGEPQSKLRPRPPPLSKRETADCRHASSRAARLPTGGRRPLRRPVVHSPIKYLPPLTVTARGSRTCGRCLRAPHDAADRRGRVRTTTTEAPTSDRGATLAR